MNHPSPISPSKIQLLTTDTINRIAAGEVIENPAGIVRELLDNAVDAGACHIEIRVNFSDFFIEIIDDGCGIYPDDVPLAFEKHSTSKIRNFEDIYSTPTLGFRGEALASLASVSEVTLDTAVGNDGEGVRYRIRGNEKDKLKKVACNRGTRIQVRDLFFNTPVRKKFLALKDSKDVGGTGDTERTLLVLKPVEKKNIKQEIIRHILSQDGIGIRYYVLERGSKERLEVNVPDHYTLKDKITMFFRNSDVRVPLEDVLLKVKNDIYGFTIEGYITDLSIREYRSDKQFLIIKNRAVRDSSFFKAVITAYLHKIPRGSHPMIFLRVKSNQSDTIDSNIHPRKEQVKFQNPKLFFDAVYTTIKNTLAENLSMDSGATPVTYSDQEPSSIFRPSQLEVASSADRFSEVNEKFYARQHHSFAVSDEAREANRQNLFNQGKLTEGISYSSYGEGHASSPIHSSDLPINVLGQVAETFIVFSIGDDLYMVDQHAAHERINYDRLLDKFRDFKNKGGVDTQILLVPILLEKDMVEIEAILLQREILDRLGFEVEPFGSNTLRINRVPAYLPENRIDRTIHALLAMIARRSSSELLDPDSVEAQEFLGDMVATMACRMSIMAGDRLSHTAMESLIQEIYIKQYFHTCPHGRPFVKKFPLKEMKLFFDRGRHILGDVEY